MPPVPPEKGGFAVARQGDLTTIEWKGTVPWSATLDATHGGVIRSFRLPASGPDLVAHDDDNSFRGMCSAFYMSRVRAPGQQTPLSDDSVKAKGTLWRRKSSRWVDVAVTGQSATEVTVAVKGRSDGWRLLGPPGEPIVEYVLRYTFAPERVVCAGEVRWVYGHDTKLEAYAIESFFAPGLVQHPVLAVHGRGQVTRLDITSSHGARLPDGVDYPLVAHVDFKHGYRLSFHAHDPAPALRSARTYILERSWQQEGAQIFGFCSADALDADRFSYRHEIGISRVPAGKAKPTVTITAPAATHRYPPTGRLVFAASAIDGRQSQIPPDRFRWRIFDKWSAAAPALEASGDSVAFDLGAGAMPPFVWAEVTVTDAQGQESREYVKLDKAP